MAISKKVEELTALIEPATRACAVDLWGVEFFQQGKHSVLRVYIDRETEEGISVEDCTEVSRQVGAILDVEDPIAGEYTLEVSSPGWDRMLFKPSQYQRYVGEEVNLRLTAPVAGRRRWRGVVEAVDDVQVTLQAEGQSVVLPFISIDKANVVSKF
ncbi:MAG: ribosome maturation factor RimP [Moraxellaceae bacterium]|nr:ribosome maturation factor RimP [Moraxellaceae bacterium]MDZ4297837.1 ribosome maturation factor RimP [Moraxellaceae bacterium]MDZ4386091.1 ribosome maturation factor RimP [Moraxellaceae bacterium]